jgi:hypothetical protein
MIISLLGRTLADCLCQYGLQSKIAIYKDFFFGGIFGPTMVSSNLTVPNPFTTNSLRMLQVRGFI